MATETDPLTEAIEDAEESGWTVADRDADQATLIRRKKGTWKAHLVVAILTIWWSYGVGNAGYFLYKYYLDADERVLDGEGNEIGEETTEETVTEVDEDVERIPMAEERHEMVYLMGNLLGSIPVLGVIFKLTFAWYRWFTLRSLPIIERLGADPTLITRFEVDTCHLYDHFFAGYRGEEKPEVDYS